MDVATFTAVGASVKHLTSSRRKVFAFGSDKPLSTIGRARLLTTLCDIKAEVDCTIVKEGDIVILGRDTSEQLGIRAVSRTDRRLTRSR
jgi:hypothetical protein